MRCGYQEALAAQTAQQPSEALQLRIGINLGDILIEEDGDVYGDGVNVAARLEQLAEPGGVCLSGKVYEEVRDKLPFAFKDKGEQTVKNIARPVRAYALAGPRVKTELAAVKPLPLPEKPSIAVLPFTNMSGDPEQEYFADGVVEDIINALSRFQNLFVIARNSSFVFKGKAVDVKEVGRQLGVRYVLAGSVRRAGNRIRITGQLIDAATGHHIWADRFDGEIADIFDLQDAVTASIVGHLSVKLEGAEIDRARRAIGNPTAYDLYLRGLHEAYKHTKASDDEALRYFRRAIEADPGFASAYGWAAVYYALRKQSRWMEDAAAGTSEGLKLARRAVQLGVSDAHALACGGFCLAYLGGELEAGAGFIATALAMNPHAARIWQTSGWVNIYLGNHDVAVDALSRAMRLSPLDPETPQIATATALAHFFAGRYDNSRRVVEPILKQLPDLRSALRVFAASNAQLGKEVEARATTQHLLQLDPTFQLAHLKEMLPLRRSSDLQMYTEALRLAGVPE
jgi:TolB-like protein/Tfp pilus assembly protein PilF